MRVAVVTGYFPNSSQPWNGHSAYQTLRELAKHCELRVFCPEPTYPNFLKPKSRAGIAVDRTWSPPDVAVTYLPYPVLPVVSRPLNGLVMGAKLLPHVRSFRPNVVLNYVIYPDGHAAVRIGHALRVPVVLTAIGSDLNRIADPLCGVFTRAALRQASFITTVSSDLATTAVKLGARPERTLAILNGCDTSVFHPQDRAAAREALGLNPTAETIVYVGRLDIRKGLIELVDAVAALRTKRPAVRCYFVGNGSDEGLVREAIAGRGAAHYIQLDPPTSTTGVAQWMSAADLVTLPSYKEGCPNVVIEALAAGRPMVATNVGGIPELMDDRSGRLVPPMDVAALTRGLDQVLSVSWDAEAIASRHNRSWADVAADLMQVLKQAASDSSDSGNARTI